MNFIHKIPKAYSKDSCNKLIKWFEKNMDKAKPGKTGDQDELKNLEICLE